MPQDVPYDTLFHWDTGASHWLTGLGGSEPAQVPKLEEKVLETVELTSWSRTSGAGASSSSRAAEAASCRSTWTTQ